MNIERLFELAAALGMTKDLELKIWRPGGARAWWASIQNRSGAPDCVSADGGDVQNAFAHLEDVLVERVQKKIRLTTLEADQLRKLVDVSVRGGSVVDGGGPGGVGPEPATGPPQKPCVACFGTRKLMGGMSGPDCPSCCS